MKARTGPLLLAMLLTSVVAIAQEKGSAPRTKILDGFEDPRSWNVTQKQRSIWANTEGAHVSLRPSMLESREGRNCFEFEYEFITDQRDGVQISLRKVQYIPDKEGKLPPPDRIGLWVCGDLSGNTIRYRFTDNKGKLWERTFPGAEAIDWTGWRYLEGPLSGIEGVMWPVRFGSLDIVDSTPEFRGRGVIKLDGLCLKWLSDEEKKKPLPQAAEYADGKAIAARIGSNLDTLQNRLAGLKAKLLSKDIREDAGGKALVQEVAECEKAFLSLKMELPAKDLIHAQGEIGCRMLALATKIDDFLIDLTVQRAKARGQKFVVFRRPLMAKILPDTVPGADEIVDDVKIAAAPGEIRAASISVFTAHRIEGLYVSATGLKGTKKTIPAKAIRIRAVRVWYQQRLTAQRGGFVDAVKTPELLEDVNGIFVPAYSTKQFWLTVHVPDDVEAGLYQGKLILKSHNLKQDEVPLKLSVYPFRLRKHPEKFRGMFYAFAGAASRSPALRENPPTRLTDFRDMAEHGIDTFIDMKPFDYFKAVGEGEGAKLDFTGVTEVMKAFKDSGLRGRMILFPFRWAVSHYHKARTGHTGTIHDADYRESYKRVVKMLDEKFRAEKWPTPYDYTFDEPREFERCLPFFKMLREAKAHVAASDFRFEFGKKMIPFCSLFIYSGGMLFENNPKRDGNMKKFLELRPKHTGMIWGAYMQTWYDGPYGWEWMRLTFGVPFLKAPVQSAWGHIYMSPGADPFLDFDGSGHKDSMTVYPSPTGSIPTIQWEMVREGANDTHYVYTLQQKIEALREKKPKAAAEAEKKLNDILDQYNEFDVRETMGRLGPADYERLRARVADTIVELMIAK